MTKLIEPLHWNVINMKDDHICGHVWWIINNSCVMMNLFCIWVFKNLYLKAKNPPKTLGTNYFTSSNQIIIIYCGAVSVRYRFSRHQSHKTNLYIKYEFVFKTQRLPVLHMTRGF